MEDAAGSSQSMSSDETHDVVVLGSGVAGLAAALAAHEAGLDSVVLEKAEKVGGTSSESYGLIWIGDNHLMRAAGETDRREDIVSYMRFLGGGELDEERMLTLVDRSPDVLRFFQSSGIPFRLVRSLVDHYYGVAEGARSDGRTVEADLVSGFDLDGW